MKKNNRRNVVIDGSVLALVLLAMIAPIMWRGFSESRFYRDIAGLTPFSQVTAYSTLYPDGLVAYGSMLKNRCKFAALIGYVTTENGKRYRYPVDTTVEEERGVSGNRPVSGAVEEWGPWKIWYLDELGPATDWEIFARHVPLNPEDTSDANCYQNNLFASGKWETTGE